MEQKARGGRHVAVCTHTRNRDAQSEGKASTHAATVQRAASTRCRGMPGGRAGARRVRRAPAAGAAAAPACACSDEVAGAAHRSHVAHDIWRHGEQGEQGKHNDGNRDCAPPLAHATHFILDVLLCRGGKAGGVKVGQLSC